MKNRRQFLLTGMMGVAATAALPASAGVTILPKRRRGKLISLEDMSLATFQNLGRIRFNVRSKDGRWIVLEMFAVQDHRPAKGEHFTLSFLGPASQPLTQDTYYFDHPQVGYFPLMIVPGRATRNRQVYAAMINRTV